MFEPAENIARTLSREFIYGPIGARWINNHKELLGQIYQGHEGRLISHGSFVSSPALVDTLDCQCVFFHTNLIKDKGLFFDENPALSFHQYVEDFCLNAKYKYGINSYAVQMKCKHLSWGKIDAGFKLALQYLESKYPEKRWAGTCTHLE